MSAMGEGVYGEAIVDIVRSETLVSDPVIIKVRENGSKIRLHPIVTFALLMNFLCPWVYGCRTFTFQTCNRGN
jgi:hypothetical protein